MSEGGSSQLPWGIQQLQPGSMKTISDSKLASFAIGQQKKTRFQKAKEEKEMKKKLEDEAAAKIYDHFVASFDVDENSKTFIRGGKIQDDSDSKKVNVGELYKLDSSNLKKKTGKSEMELMLEDFKSGGGINKETDSHRSRSIVSQEENTSKKEDKNKQIDDFLHEIMNRQDPKATTSTSTLIPEPENPDLEKGSFDSGDPNTTNLYVGNLAPSITEEQLNELFSKFGTINSVKVMWPRTEEERARKRNCGFVSFKKRSDAEDAMIELNETVIDGYKMSIGWGKAVKINAIPFSLPTAQGLGTLALTPGTLATTLTGIIPPVISGSNFSGPLTTPTAAVHPSLPLAPGLPLGLNSTESASLPTGTTPAAPPTTALSSLQEAMNIGAALTMSLKQPTTTTLKLSGKWDAAPVIEERDMTEHDTRITIIPPPDAKQRSIIDLIAKFVSADGDAFEQSIKSRESGNAEFGFLSQPESDFGRYYRWRTLAFIMGDDETKWREKPFQIVVDGPFWIPPPMPPPLPPSSNRRDDEEEDRENKYRNRSSDRSRRSSGSSSRRRSGSHSSDSSHGSEEEGGGGRRGSRRVSADSKRHGDDVRDCDRSSRSVRDRDRDRDRPRSRSRSKSPSPSRRSDGRSSSSRRDRRDTEESDVKKYAGMTGAQIERLKAKERGSKKAKLSDSQYDQLEEALQTLTISRQAIVEAMGMALDNVDAAEEVVSLLKESLLVAATPPPVKIARLYLLSDILHNSGAHVRNASNYRTLIQACLPEVFEALGSALRGASGRMTARQIEERVMAVLQVWERWAVFPPTFLLGLEAAFMRSETEEKIVASHSQQIVSIDDDSLKRKAKLMGVATEGAIAGEIQAKLVHVGEYTKRKKVMSGGGIEAMGSFFLSSGPGPWPMEAEEENINPQAIDTMKKTSFKVATKFSENYDDDVDGMPMTNPDDDGDDIDGVPLDSTTSGFSSSTTQQYASYNDDVDGVPFDDVDGVPLDISLPASSFQENGIESFSHEKIQSSSTAAPTTLTTTTISSSKPTHERSNSFSGGGNISPSSSYDSDDDKGPGRISFDTEPGNAPQQIIDERKRLQELQSIGTTLTLNASEEEDRRLMVRSVEATLLLLRDSLESKKILPEDIEEHINGERQRQMAEWEVKILTARRKARRTLERRESEDNTNNTTSHHHRSSGTSKRGSSNDRKKHHTPSSEEEEDSPRSQPHSQGKTSSDDRRGRTREKESTKDREREKEKTNEKSNSHKDSTNSSNSPRAKSKSSSTRRTKTVSPSRSSSSATSSSSSSSSSEAVRRESRKERTRSSKESSSSHFTKETKENSNEKKSYKYAEESPRKSTSSTSITKKNEKEKEKEREMEKSKDRERSLSSSRGKKEKDRRKGRRSRSRTNSRSRSKERRRSSKEDIVTTAAKKRSRRDSRSGTPQKSRSRSREKLRKR